MALGVAACGGGSSGGASTSGGGKQAAKDVTLAMITATTTQNAFQEMAFGAKAAAGVEGVKLNSAAPNGINGPQEVQLFQAAMQTSKDGIATMTTTPDLFVRPFSQAVARGIPQVSVDTPPPAGSNVDTFVGNDNVQVGEVLANAILAKIPANATGEIVLGNPIPGLPVLDQRVQGIKQVLQQKRPNVKLVGPLNTGPEPTQNFNAWQGIVKAHPDALAYLDPATGRRLARPHPAATGKGCSSAARTSTRSRCRRCKDGRVSRSPTPSTGSRATSRSPCSPAGRATARRCRRAGGTRGRRS